DPTRSQARFLRGEQPWIAIAETGADLAIAQAPAPAEATTPPPATVEHAPAFEVAATTDTPTPKPGERLGFAVAARSPVGAPLAGAAVEWSLRARRHALRFPGYEDYAFDAGAPCPPMAFVSSCANAEDELV